VGPSASAHQYRVSALEWYPLDTGLFISASFDSTVRVWDTNLLQVSSYREGLQSTVSSELPALRTVPPVALSVLRALSTLPCASIPLYPLFRGMLLQTELVFDMAARVYSVSMIQGTHSPAHSLVAVASHSPDVRSLRPQLCHLQPHPHRPSRCAAQRIHCAPLNQAPSPLAPVHCTTPYLSLVPAFMSQASVCCAPCAWGSVLSLPAEQMR